MKAPIRILIAEDNEDHRFLIVRALRSMDGVQLEVEAVANGQDALDFLHQAGEYADRERPHLIMLDLKMPRVDGLEVLRLLKEHPDLRSIPVVVLSASERPEDIDSSYRLGANSFVTKPTAVGAFREGLMGIRRYWTELSALPEPPR